MDDRVDEFLGRIRHGVTDPERADAESVTRAIDGTRRFIGSRPAPDVSAAVLRRINEVQPAPATPAVGLLIRLAGKLWQPVAITIRPAYAVAGVALVAAVLISPTVWPGPGVVQPPIAAAPPLFVQFRLETSASTVQLMGSFTGWERRYDLHQTAPGLWTLTLPLAEGVHDYAFLVDGQQWVADPYASQVSDGFGGINSRLTLLLPASTTRS
jgi:hypothetical protein